MPFRHWWPLVNLSNLKTDAMAGFTGALIVFPQGVAFATIAGLPPQYGLYAAMVPAVVAALFGSSWHMVSGPTTAISIALFAALQDFAEPGTEQYIRLALTLTFLVGLYSLILGLARMGALVNFISHTVVIGFTAGAAMLIAGSQISSFFGVSIPRGTPFINIVEQFLGQLRDINPYVTAVGIVTLVSGVLARRFIPKFPYMIAAMVVGGVAAALVNHQFGGEAATGIMTVGAIPTGLPPLSTPDFSLLALQQTALPALVITMLALTEAVSISRAIATRSEQLIDGNQEFVGQGLSNILGSFFSSYASSGSFNRSGVNYEAGARTPLATVFAAAVLVVIVLFVAPLAVYLPTAAMAGILFLVAWGLIDFHHIKSIWQTSKPETAILWVTLVGTVINLERGIFLGMLLSLIIYLYRTSRPEIETVVPVGEPRLLHFEEPQGRPECPQIRFVRIHGAVYFGAVDHIQRTLQQIDADSSVQKTAVIAAPAISFVDVAGAEMLAQEARRRRRLGGGLYFWELKGSVYEFLHQGEYLRDIGEDSIFPVRSDMTSALYSTLDPDVCRPCQARIFHACHGDKLPDGNRRLRLMFATDGTVFSHAPRDVALALASRLKITLDVMTMAASTSEEHHGRARLDETAEIARQRGVEAETMLYFGSDPAREVAAAVQAADIRLLVIGRRPPEGLADRMVGTHAAKIIDETQSSVLVVPRDGRMWQRRILVGYDGNPSVADSLSMAGTLARATGVPVTLGLVTKKGAPPDDALLAQANEDAESLRREGVDAEARVVAGMPADALAALAREVGADLIILGKRHGGLYRLLPNSPTDRLIGASEWPVLIAKRTRVARLSTTMGRRA